MKIAVIGDIILDKYTFGDVDRISPEAPIQILKVTDVEYKLGGAGNVASNLDTYEADVTLFGIIGDDNYGKELVSKLGNVTANFAVSDARPTILKERMFSRGQQLLRVDTEQTDEIEIFNKDNIKIFKDFDAIIISDYAKGVVTNKLLELLTPFKHKIFVDPKPQHADYYKDVLFITPNSKECMEMSGMDDDIEGAKYLVNKLNTNILLTRGEKGMRLFQTDGTTTNYKVKALKVKDITGAGDTVIATLVWYWCTGIPIKNCVDMANKAAGIAVKNLGCYQVKLNEL